MAKTVDHLAQDAARALAAGMSYGKWKAMHPHTVEQMPEKEEDIRRCPICGREIPESKHFQRYCSKECAYEAVKIKNREFARKKREKQNEGNA